MSSPLIFHDSSFCSPHPSKKPHPPNLWQVPAKSVANGSGNFSEWIGIQGHNKTLCFTTKDSRTSDDKTHFFSISPSTSVGPTSYFWIKSSKNATGCRAGSFTVPQKEYQISFCSTEAFWKLLIRCTICALWGSISRGRFLESKRKLKLKDLV